MDETKIGVIALLVALFNDQSLILLFIKFFSQIVLQQKMFYIFYNAM